MLVAVFVSVSAFTGRSEEDIQQASVLMAVPE